MLPPLVYGLGMFIYLLFHGRKFDVVHTASFPFFSMLAAELLRRPCGYRLVADWHEFWTKEYWLKYIGKVGGRVGWIVQYLCALANHQAICFSNTHKQRLELTKHRGKVLLFPGGYSKRIAATKSLPSKQFVIYAGRHISEKRVPALVEAFALVHKKEPHLRCKIFGDGPKRSEVLEKIDDLGLQSTVDAPGFVDREILESAQREALCTVLPSVREGFGIVVLESCSHGVPAVVVNDPDNAACELVQEGVNGFIAKDRSAESLAEAILSIHKRDAELRSSTAQWFAKNSERLSLDNVLEQLMSVYRS